MTSKTLSPEQLEIIELLRYEINEIAKECQTLLEAHSRANNANGLGSWLGSLETQLEQIGNAAELAGLLGLHDYCLHIAENLSLINLSCGTDLTVNQEGAKTGNLGKEESRYSFITRWPNLLLAYISNFRDGRDYTDVVNQLIACIGDTTWPRPMTIEQAENLLFRFNNSSLTTLGDDELEPIPTTAHADMLSLKIGHDVRPDLVEGMLIELPEQVRQFEGSVNRYLESLDFDQLSQAQRMAHTLKGAANIVGIDGIANLMHYTEDLLETAAKHEDVDASFGELLLDASDCLATMAEYLCGIGEPPTNGVAVLQSLLDWLHQLKGETLDFSGLAQREQYEPGHLIFDPTGTNETKKALQENHTGEIFESNSDLESTEDISLTQSEESYKPISNLERSNQNGNIAFTDFDTNSGEALDNEQGLLLELVDSDESMQTTYTENTDGNGELLDTNSALVDKPEADNAKTPESEPPLEVENKSKNSKENRENEERHHLNLPETTAHELLRIAGETQIANTQVMAQVNALNASIQLSDRFHKKIKSMAAELEALAQTQSVLHAASVKSTGDEMDPLELERYSELQSFSHQLLELATDSHEAVEHVNNQIRDLTSLAYTQKQLNQDGQDILLELRMVPAALLSSRFNRCVRQASRLTGKPARLNIIGAEMLIDSRVLNRISDPLMHLLRNAVDHGLEHSSEIRKHAGKPTEGSITLEFKMSGEIVSICCRDDGKGLDYEKIKTTAIERELISSDESVDNELLNQLILVPGFTTKNKASHTSGRGIGLDAVLAEVKSLKGNLSISSEANTGTSFTITVPTSILTGHALVVRSSGSEGTQLLSIVSRSVEQIIYVKQEQIIKEGNQAYYDYQDQKILVYDINELTNIHRYQSDRIGALLISKKTDGHFVAIAVESVLASQPLVIKALNKYTYRPEGIIGATILGDGTVSPVIDLQELPGMSLSPEAMDTLRSQRAKISEIGREQQFDPPTALIVDDSLSARRSLAQFISDIGMDVHTARDGFEAINAINEKKPALMLVDLEMPKMNGLELTAHVRSREDTRDIPIIMITSRTAEKHRSLAENAGVDTYINKPWSDEELLNCIQQQIA